MKGAKLVWDGEKFTPGKASPWLPPEHLRRLPAQWVTKDTSDPDRIHELDAPHIVSSLTEEQAKKERESGEDFEASVFKGIDIWDGPFDQVHIDWVRFKAIRNLIRAAMIHAERGAPFSLKRIWHLYFPKPELHVRQLRRGRPPLRSDLPQHLKDKDLIVDVYNWPPRVVDELRARGVEVPKVEELEAELSKRLLVYP